MRYLLILTAFALSSCATTPDTAPSAAVSGNYTLDSAHTSVVWSLSHAGLSQFTARFDDVTGTLDFDSEAPENSRLDIRIDPLSVSTGLPDFDKTIGEGGRYFDGLAHPVIRFVSTDVIQTGDTRGTVTGHLSFRGETRPLTLDITFNGAGKSFGHPGDTLGFSATGTLNRSDFGLTYLKNFGIGEEVTLRIETEFNESRP